MAARSRGSTEHVLGLRFTGFLMVSSVRRGMRLPVRVHDLEMLPEGVRSETEKGMDPYELMYGQIRDRIQNCQEKCP